MEGFDKSLPLAEAFIDVEQSGESQHNKSCLNCGSILTDTFCAHCGQKDIPKRQTLGELFLNFVSSFWSYESKFFKSGQYLLFKPGFLALEYNAGRRERYFHPARMYVFISFFYFLLFTSLPDADSEKTNNNVNVKSKKGEVIYDNKGTNFSLDGIEYKSLAQYDSAQQALPENKRASWIERLIKKREIELNNRYKGDSDGFKKAFGDTFTANFSKVFFLLLPVFALLLKLLYVRRDFYYSEHLVFSIYYYNFFFLAGCLYMIFDITPWVSWMSTVIGFWIALYLLLGMKRMYGQGWGKTIVKYCTLALVFSFCLGIGLLINLGITLMSI